MQSFGPINDQFIALDGELCYISIADSVTLNAGLNTLEVILDFQMDALPSGASESIMGSAAVADGFYIFLGNDGSIAFGATRGTVYNFALSAVGAIEAGKRYIVRGVDDGETVKLWINGTLAPTTDTPAAAQLDNPAAIQIGLGTAGTDFNKMRVFGAQIRQDGLVTMRLLPREGSGTTLRDLSGYNQAITLAGTAVEGVNFWWGSAWNTEPMSYGLV